jgi:hypothetical protein
MRYISDLTLDAVRACSIMAAAKHGDDKVLLSPDMPRAEKLAALGEEFGEVCRELTYDTFNGNTMNLVKELLQLSQLAASWAEAEDRLARDQLYMREYVKQAQRADAARADREG